MKIIWDLGCLISSVLKTSGPTAAVCVLARAKPDSTDGRVFVFRGKKNLVKIKCLNKVSKLCGEAQAGPSTETPTTAVGA